MIGSGSMVIGVHTANSQSDEVAALRFCFVGAGGGALGQPQVFGNSRHSKLIHCPAWGPLVKHSSPIGTGPLWTVQVGDGGDTVEVDVGVSMTGPTVSGPQSPSSGHGDASLAGRGLPGMAP